MEKGTRVGAVQSADATTVKLYGYGIYEGDEIPPKEIDEILAEIGIPNPKITLDNGNVVWGCQCWWGSEERVKKMIGDRKVEIVDVE
jgi:hypothetical protein